jgi:hypothetical protein
MPTPQKAIKRSVGKAPRTSPSDDWRHEVIAQVRDLINQAVPDAVEEVKWRKPSNGMQGVPVWSHDGIICTAESYKNAVKLTFAKGASLEDPAGLFNTSLEGGTRRAIDLREGDKVNSKAFKALIRSAAAFNSSSRNDAKPSPRTLKGLRTRKAP